MPEPGYQLYHTESIRFYSVHRYRMTRSFQPVCAPRVLLNIALSAHGLVRIGIDIAAVEDGFFLSPMGSIAASLGDAVDASMHPTEYVVGDTWENTPDILLIIGGDTVEAATRLNESLRAAASMAVPLGCFPN